eukprot:4826472-Pleurochrysis_carterae.AAC.1
MGASLGRSSGANTLAAAYGASCEDVAVLSACHFLCSRRARPRFRCTRARGSVRSTGRGTRTCTCARAHARTHAAMDAHACVFSL